MLDNGGYVCTMFMNLSKAFDTIHHDLMIAKFGFSQDALQYMRGYLTNIQQRVRVNINLVLGKTLLPEFLMAQY